MRKPFFAFLLFKRLFRRPGFLVLLVLIPALTLCYTSGSRQDAGMVTVALAREAEDDPLAQSTMLSLSESTQMLRFLLCDNPQQAIAKVEAGKADCAWVFQAGMRENVETFIRTRSQNDAFVTIYLREPTVLLTLARERLNAAVYESIARELYVAGLVEDYEAFAAMPRETLLRFWENARIPGQLFSFTQAQGTAPDQGYLLSPIRGLLAALVLLGALAAGMYHSRDEQAGTFGYLSAHLAPLPELLSLLWASAGLSVAMGLSLALSGLTGPVFREFLCLLGLSLGCTGFAMALRRLFPKIGAMAALLPLVITAALVASPVFFTVDALAPVGYLMPVSHYLWAVTDFSRFPWLLLYSAVCFFIAFVPKRGRK